MHVYFTDCFQVGQDDLEDYGAFDVSLINDLPLFIDPFLLFTSNNPEYRKLHDQIIDYLKFLRDQSVAGIVNDGLLKAWYMFPEVKQLWLGFSLRGNGGSGLGIDFARALHENLHVIFTNFGNEQITKGSHLEKVCLVQDGVGRDNISDFTANLIKEYLLTYTQDFARQHVPANLRRSISIPNVRFDYERRVWRPQVFELPYIARERDFVLLTPKDILTKDENWINRHDLMERFEQVASSVPDDRLRSEVNQYLYRQLTPKSTNDERHRAYSSLIREHPQLIEWYIRAKEDQGGEAQRVSQLRVSDSEVQFVDHIRELIGMLVTETKFYEHGIDTLTECRARVAFLKEEIENCGAFRLFYHDGKPIQRESDLQILFRLTWFATPSDFNSEVNNGRGPVDFAISRGSKDKAIVEFKLAKNSKLRQNLENQVAIYEKSNRTDKSLKVIFCFDESEQLKVKGILRELKLEGDNSIVLIDCRADNKPSASNVTSKTAI